MELYISQGQLLTVGLASSAIVATDAVQHVGVSTPIEVVGVCTAARKAIQLCSQVVGKSSIAEGVGVHTNSTEVCTAQAAKTAVLQAIRQRLLAKCTLQLGRVAVVGPAQAAEVIQQAQVEQAAIHTLLIHTRGVACGQAVRAKAAVQRGHAVAVGCVQVACVALRCQELQVLGRCQALLLLYL